MSLFRQPRYRTTNWKQYNTTLKARGSLSIWLDKRMTWFAAGSGKRERSPKFSDAAIQFCLMLKSLFGLTLRQTTGLVESVLQLCGLAWPVPDFSTLCPVVPGWFLMRVVDRKYFAVENRKNNCFR